MNIELTPGREEGSCRAELNGLAFEAAFGRRAGGRPEADVTVYRGGAVVHRDLVDLARVEARSAFAATLKRKAAVDGAASAEDLERILLALGEQDRRNPRARARGGVAGLALELVAPDGIPADLTDAVRELRLPAPYRLDEGVLLGDKGITITTTPVLPAFEVDDVDLGVRLLGCLLFVRQQWRLETLPRGELLDRKRIIGRLAPLGVDVASGTEFPLIAFLQAYLRTNGDRLKLRRRTARLGLHRLGGRPAYVLDDVYPADVALVFDAVDDDAIAMRAAMAPRGTLEGWTACARSVLPFAVPVTAGLLAPLVPPLREALGLPGVRSSIADLAGPSSAGKTAVQRLGCSLYADPFSEQWIKPGNASYAGAEKLCLRTFGLPVFLEDVHLMSPEDKRKLIYSVVNEQFRARGGDRRHVSNVTHSVLIVSGEVALVSEASYMGEAARVMAFEGLPFGDQTPARAQFVDGLLEGLAGHYGHVGRALVRRLAEASAATREAWCRDWHGDRQAFIRAAEGHIVLVRQAPLWAAMALAARLLAELTGLERVPLTDALERAFALAKTERPPSRAQRAYELLVSEVRRQPNSCFKWNGVGYITPNFSGARVGVQNIEQGWIGTFPSVTDRVLRYAGFEDPSAVLRAMRTEKLLDAKPGRFTTEIQCAGEDLRIHKLSLVKDTSDDDEEAPGGRGDAP